MKRAALILAIGCCGCGDLHIHIHMPPKQVQECPPDLTTNGAPEARDDMQTLDQMADEVLNPWK